MKISTFYLALLFLGHELLAANTSGLVVTIIPSSAVFCPGSPITLCAQVSGGDMSNLNYLWSGPTNFGATNTPCITVSSVSSSDTYTVIVANNSTPSSTNGSSASVTITAAAQPTLVEVTLHPHKVSLGQRLTLTAIADGNPAPTFSWNDQTGPLGEGSSLTLPYVPANESITVTAHNCAGLLSATLPLDVTPLPD